MPGEGFGSNLGFPPMAHQHRSSGRKQEIAPPPDEEVVRLSVFESDLAQQLDAMPSPVPERTGRLEVDQELDPLAETESDPDAAAEELGVGWDTEEQSADKATPMGWLSLMLYISCRQLRLET